MLEAARQLRANKEARDKTVLPLSKVLADTGAKLPARSTAQLTVPKEFALHESKTPNAQHASGGSAHSADLPIAQAVADFSKTPKRFRSKSAIEPPTPPSAPSSLTTTVPKSFTLLSEMRHRQPAKSREQLDAEYLKSVPAFKAKPVDKRVLDSAGDIGVKRVLPRKPTEFAEFDLASTKLPLTGRRHKGEDDAHSDAGSTHSAPAYSFKARPFNRQLMAGKAAGLAQVTPRKTTRPKSPKLSTGVRGSVRQSAPPHPEEFAAFKARPMPDHSASPHVSPRKPPPVRPTTAPKPFALEGVARHEVAEQVEQTRIAEAKRAEEAARAFKARPMPVGDAWVPKVDSKHTEAAPFALTTEARHEVAAAQLAAKTKELEACAQKEREFKAREPKVLGAPAFEARKSTKPLTEISEAKFQRSEAQFARRKAFEAELAQRRAHKEAETTALAEKKALDEAAALAELRKQLVHKPMKVMKGGAFVTSAVAPRPLTKPKAPNLSSIHRNRAPPPGVRA